MEIRAFDTIDEVASLEEMLSDYIRFVCSDLERTSGISFDPASLIDSTMGSLDKVVPPMGRTFVASDGNGDRLGMVFLRRSGPEGMEIKRLFVRPEARGTGAGRALVDAAIKEARSAGARTLRLDTTRNLEAAIGLYRSAGFDFCEPYPESDHFGDEVLADALVFMEKRLV